MPRIYLSPPHMGEDERALLLNAFDSNWVAPLGPHVDAFEREFGERVEVPFCAALSSGTAGLHLALLLTGVQPGQEVITSSFTFAATANAIRYVGATPVFLDSDASTWNMDPKLLAEELESCDKRGKLPAAVIAVDLYGQCADIDQIAQACARYDVPLIEDAAEALGATYRGRHAGSSAAMGVFSFNGNKIITTSGGGMLVSHRRDWIDRARFLAQQARDPAPHYQHSIIGYNYRLSNLLAAVGRGQLRHLDDRIARRRDHNAFYRRALGECQGVTFMPEASYGRSTFWLTCVRIDPRLAGVDREHVRRHLESKDIESRPVWKPLHLQPVFSECRVRGGRTVEHIFDTGLCLPSGSNLTDAQREVVAATFVEAVS